MAVTIKDIAAKLNVSISTVSKGLNGAPDISEQLRQIILDTAIEMGYQTKQMRKEVHKKLVIFVEHLDYNDANDFSHDIVLGFRQMAARDKWSVDVLPITNDFQLENKYDSFMLKNGYFGAFFIGSDYTDEWMKGMPTTNTPTVILDSQTYHNSNVATISTNDEEAFEYSIKYLSSLGHKNFALLNGPQVSFAAVLRDEAFRKCLKDNDLEYNSELSIFADYSQEVAKGHVSKFIDAGVTAILCGCDDIAFGVINELISLGYRVPEDISVIGHDDIPPAESFTPPVSSIRQDRIELGRGAYMGLNSLVHHVGMSTIQLHPNFVARQSSGPCKTQE